VTDPLTPNLVVKQLVKLAEDLDQAVSLLKDAERDAVTKRHAADMAESKAFVRAEGPMEIRKHLARIAADQAEDEALVAEATLRWLRARIRAIDTRIEIGRSMGAALRAELKTLPYGESP